jgi:aspartate-semialdehyde dehydrogenase
MTRPLTGKSGFRIGLAGAASLLGQEILRVLKERNFPTTRVATFEAEQEDPEIPVLDLSDHLAFAEVSDETAPEGLDVLFLAARPRSKAGEPSLLGRALEAAGFAGTAPTEPRCLVIDSAEALSDVPGRTLLIPSLETALRAAPEPALSSVRESPHPATIVLSRLLLRLAQHFAVKDCVAQVYIPASEMGPRAIEELQKQTINLLSFQKIPQKVFGAQLAFNLLSRLPGKHASEISDIESRIRRELRPFLAGRVALPAFQLCQVAVFYSLAFSIYVALDQKATVEAVSAALAGEHITIRRRSEAAPTQVDAAGSGDILVDAVTADPDRAQGYWIWAAVDNIRLAAENAVDIAETLLQPHHPRQ